MAFMVLAFSLVVITLSLEAWIFYVLQSGLDMAGKIQIAVCLVLIVAINATAFLLPMKIGAKRLSGFSP
jgi:hypothetical protein